MDIVFYIVIFLYGLIVGSFLNVVIARYNSGVSIVSGKSMCFSCGKTLSWKELVPIFSFLIQKGKCKSCKTKISIQYPVVEFLTGIIFVVIFMNTLNILASLYFVIIFSLLITISVYDLKHKIIPDGLVYLFSLLSLLGAFFLGEAGATQLIAGPALASPFALIWLVSKGKWMGLGDAKLALGIGWLLGLSSGAAVIVLSFWVGAIFGILLIILGHIVRLNSRLNTFTIKSEVPFGPFLALCTLAVWFFGINFFSLIPTF